MKVAILTDTFPSPLKSFTNYRLLTLIQKKIQVKVFFRQPGDQKLLYEYPFNEMQRLGGTAELLSKGSLINKLIDLMFGLLNPTKRKIECDFWRKSESGTPIRNKLRTLLIFKNIIDWKADLIHVDESYLGKLMWEELILLRIPIVISLRGSDVDRKPYKYPAWKIWYEKVASEKTIYFHCVSKHIARKAIEHGIAKEKTNVIYAGFKNEIVESSENIEPALALQDKKKTTTLISVCRLSPEKGIEIALKAVQRLCSQGIDVEYEIIGGGTQLEELKELSDKLDIRHRVIFHEEKDNLFIIKYMKKLVGKAIYIQPSLFEAFGFSMLEAAAAGLPIIASDVGGIPEFIEDGKTGILFAKGNPKDLAEKIETLVIDTKMQEILSTNAKLKLKREFLSTLEVDYFISWYKEIIA